PLFFFFFFSSRRRHTRWPRDWSSDVCSSDLFWTLFMVLNTLYQLIALQKQNPELLDAADCLLMMPDFFHWCLTGARTAEFTIAKIGRSSCRERVYSSVRVVVLEEKLEADGML